MDLLGLAGVESLMGGAFSCIGTLKTPFNSEKLNARGKIAYLARQLQSVSETLFFYKSPLISQIFGFLKSFLLQ